MTEPTIHSNGTSRAALLEQTCAAGRAVQAAMTALEAAAPNGRDYYPQGPAAWKAVTREHEARVERLWSVVHELEALAWAISQAEGPA